MATTHSPGRRELLSPSFRVGSLLASIFRSAMSLKGSDPIKFRLEFTPVGQPDDNLVGTVHNVMVGDDVTVGLEDKTGTRTAPVWPAITRIPGRFEKAPEKLGYFLPVVRVFHSVGSACAGPFTKLRHLYINDSGSCFLYQAGKVGQAGDPGKPRAGG